MQLLSCRLGKQVAKLQQQKRQSSGKPAGLCLLLLQVLAPGEWLSCATGRRPADSAAITLYP